MEKFMSDRSKIEWTDASWNPIRGCTKVSPGCKNCYAETLAERFRGVNGSAFDRGFDLRLVPEALDKPLHWRKPRRVFVNSVSDLFQEGVPTHYIAEIGKVMQKASWHVFQVLTKRHERMRELLNGELKWMGSLPNVWWGVSVEDQEYGIPRIDVLLGTNAVTRFLSIEPLLESLGEIDLRAIDWS
jgi:protein gp37